MGMINVLREAAERSAPEAAAESREQSPDPPEKLRDTTLDEYPMPDPDYTMADLEQSGYLDGDLLPLSQDRALELIDKDMTVYVICVDESPVMAFDREEIEARFPGTLFAVSREEWEESQDFQQAIADRRNHQEERESAFLNHSGDCFAIYQVRDDPALEDIRFESLEWIKSKAVAVMEGYHAVLFDSNDVTDGRGRRLVISGVLVVELIPELIQGGVHAVCLRQRGGVDQVIIFPFGRVPFGFDPLQGFKANILQRGVISDLINGK